MDSRELMKHTKSQQINVERQQKDNVLENHYKVVNQEDISRQTSCGNYDTVVAIRQKAGKLKEHIPMRGAIVEPAFTELNENTKLDQKEREERIKDFMRRRIRTDGDHQNR